MRNKLGIVLMAIGLAMLVASAGLLTWNHREADCAEAASKQLQSAVCEAIAKNLSEESHKQRQETSSGTEPPAPKMKEVEVDGYLCVGYLTIARLNLELPVLASCTDANMKISSCLFSGTTMEDNMVVVGHNYRRHFGPIQQLKEGDEVIFVDMDGVAIHYAVSATDVVIPSAAEEVTSGQFDLALLTCTYGGDMRLVVYCDRK